MPSFGQIILALILITIGFAGGILVGMYFSNRNQSRSSEDTSHDSPAMQDSSEQLSNSAEPPAPVLSNSIEVSESEVSKTISPEVLEVKENPQVSIEKQPRDVVESSLQSPEPASQEQTDAIEKKPVIQTSPSAPLKTQTPPVVKSPSLSIAEQVDEVLQEMLKNRSEINKEIRLTQGLHGGIVVWVNQRSFDEIDDVPDDEIRSLIRAAAAEWNRRSTTIR